MAAKLSKYVQLQDLLYKFVVDNMKTDKQTKEDALYLCVESDRFWTDCFDEVYREFEDPTPAFGPEDALEECLNSIFDNIFDYYNNRLNHHPGYKEPRFDPYFTYSFNKYKKLYREVKKLLVNKRKK